MENSFRHLITHPPSLNFRATLKNINFEAPLWNPVKDFLWELVGLIFGNLFYLNNREISSFEVLKVTSRFLFCR